MIQSIADDFTVSQLAAIREALAAIGSLGTPDAHPDAGDAAQHAANLARALMDVAQANSALDREEASQLAECAAQLCEFLPVRGHRERIWTFLAVVLRSFAEQQDATAPADAHALLHAGQTIAEEVGVAASADSLAAMFGMSEEERSLFGLDDMVHAEQTSGTDSDLFAAEPLTLFAQETQERLEGVAPDLVRLRAMPDDMAAREGVRRAFHTIKGGAALLSLPGVEQIAKAAQYLMEEAEALDRFDTEHVELLERAALVVLTGLQGLDRSWIGNTAQIMDGQEDFEERVAQAKQRLTAVARPTSQQDRPALLRSVSQNLYNAYVLRLPQDLRALHAALMAMRHDIGDQQAMAEARRALHGLKSRSSMVQIMPLVRLAGQAEDLLEAIDAETDTYRATALIDLIVQAEEVFYEAQRALREGAFDTRYPVLEKSAAEMLRDMTEGLDLWTRARTPAPVALAGGVRHGQGDQQDVGIAAMVQVRDAMPPPERPIQNERMAPPTGPVPVEQKELLEGSSPTDGVEVPVRATDSMVATTLSLPARSATAHVAALHEALAALAAEGPPPVPHQRSLFQAPTREPATASGDQRAVRVGSTAPPSVAKPATIAEGGEIAVAALDSPLGRLAALEALLNASRGMVGQAGSLVGQQRRNIERLDALVVRLLLEREELRRRNRQLREQVGPQVGNGGWDELEIESYDPIDQTMVQLQEIVADGRELSTGLRTAMDRLEGTARRAATHATDSRGDLLALRMVSLQAQRERLDQIAMSTASRLGKQIRFEMRADVLLDRDVAQALEVPLQHMVRNAVYHGAEMPDDRRYAGKDATANVLVHAYDGPTGVIIEVSDDGRGIDLDRVVAVSVGRGIVPQAQVAALTDRQKSALIFASGVSTADTPSDLAGRGVGMEAVQAAMRRVRGDVEVQSAAGRGTRVILRAPRSLASALVVIVRQNDHELAVPFEQVLDSHEVVPSQLIPSAGGRVLPLGERVLPVYPGGLLECAAQDEATPSLSVLEIATARGPIGMLVAEVVGVEAALIDAVPPLLGGVAELLGFLPVDAGRARPLVDAGRVLAAGMRPTGSDASGEEARRELPAIRHRRSVLVVDDSTSVRRYLSTLFQGAGYLVREAASGVEALQDIVRRGLPDLVTLDVEMPVMDGLETLNALRQRYGSRMPIFMITSRAQDRHRDAARSLGASRFFNKPFNSAEVLGAAELAAAAQQPVAASPGHSPAVA